MSELGISDEAVEAAAKELIDRLKANELGYVDAEDPTEATVDVREFDLSAAIRAALEAAAPHMLDEADLMRWKLQAIREWSEAMINQSHSPQYGRDVKTILDVSSMDKAKEIDAL